MAQQTIYSNGPINGGVSSWQINQGDVVSDTFTTNGSTPVAALNFASWVFPGDTLASASVSITSSEFGGTTFFNGTVNFTQSGCSGNQYGFNVCSETGTFGPVNLAAGNYWVNLSNATLSSGDPVYWDENSGPSSASENTLGTIPSEAFTVLGASSTSSTTTTTGGGGSVPEPSTFMLLGSGILGVMGVVRRRTMF